jgi:hypothetical protein
VSPDPEFASNLSLDPEFNYKAFLNLDLAALYQGTASVVPKDPP